MNKEEVSKVLHQLSKQGWKQQLESLKSLKPTEALAKMVGHLNYSSDLASLFLDRNPRPQLISTLSHLIRELFQDHSAHLISFANILIAPACLLRLLNSPNHVISGTVNELIKTIIASYEHQTPLNPRPRFIGALEQEFIESKNAYVRQKISLYLMFMIQGFYPRKELLNLEKKVIRVGLQDASEAVRANMRDIMQTIHQTQQENQIKEYSKKPSGLVHDKKNIKSHTPVPLTHKDSNTLSINQSSIIECFGKESEVPTKLDLTVEDMQDQETILFHLDRLNVKNNWPQFSYSFNLITSKVKRQFLEYCSSKVHIAIIDSLSPILAEKRSKVGNTAVLFLLSLMEVLVESSGQRGQVIEHIVASLRSIIQTLVKVDNGFQQQANRLISMLIQLTQSNGYEKIAYISTILKAYHEKLFLLDSLVRKVDIMKQGRKKTSPVIKHLGCHLNTNHKEKELSFAALAVISQLKVYYPEQVLTALLCQSDKVLSKIMDLAESIDPALKEAILIFIQKLKNPKPQKKAVKRDLSGQLEKEIDLVARTNKESLERIGQIVLRHTDQLSESDFAAFLEAIGKLYCKGQIVQYQIILNQLRRLQSYDYLQALLRVTSNWDSLGLVESHWLVLVGELGHCAAEWEGSRALHVQLQVAGYLSRAYRTSQSTPQRHKAIQALGLLQEGVLEQSLTPEQMQLVLQYRNHTRQAQKGQE